MESLKPLLISSDLVIIIFDNLLIALECCVKTRKSLLKDILTTDFILRSVQPSLLMSNQSHVFEILNYSFIIVFLTKLPEQTTCMLRLTWKMSLYRLETTEIYLISTKSLSQKLSLYTFLITTSLGMFCCDIARIECSMVVLLAHTLHVELFKVRYALIIGFVRMLAIILAVGMCFKTSSHLSTFPLS